MDNSNGHHYDFMKLAITSQKVLRAPQVVFSKSEISSIKNPDGKASRIAIFKGLQNVCLCEEQSIPVITLGSFSDGFSDGFDI